MPADARSFDNSHTMNSSKRPWISLATTSISGSISENPILAGTNSWKSLRRQQPTRRSLDLTRSRAFQSSPPRTAKAISTVQKVPGGLSAESFLSEFLELLELHNSDAVLPTERGKIVRGDICKTLPHWLDQNPEARFCLVNMDVDIYEPTMIILEGCWDRVVSGGVIILDEYATSKWPGETRAWDDFAKKRDLDVMLNWFSWANAPGAYVIKP